MEWSFATTIFFGVAKQRLAVRLALIRATLAFTGGSTAEESLWKLQDRRLTKMTLAIVSTFVICWGPHIIVSCVGLRIQTVTVEMLRFVGLAIAFSTALLHPLLYTFMRQDFRRALKNRWMSQKVLRKGFRNRKVGNDASVANNGSVWTLTRDTIHDTLSAGWRKKRQREREEKIEQKAKRKRKKKDMTKYP